jgi:surface protein
MFSNADVFNQDINSWNVSSVTDMNSMFSYADAFNRDLNSWDVTSVTGMRHMFYAATSFNQDLSGWCVSNIGTRPNRFDDNASSWSLARPAWGTCP